MMVVMSIVLLVMRTLLLVGRLGRTVFGLAGRALGRRTAAGLLGRLRAGRISAGLLGRVATGLHTRRAA